MTKAIIEDLLHKLDRTKHLEATLLGECAAAVRAVFPGAPNHPEVLADPTDGVLLLVDGCLPHWSIEITGRAEEPDGHWHCLLREAPGSDDDEIVGLGRGPVVSIALLEALLKVALLKSPN